MEKWKAVEWLAYSTVAFLLPWPLFSSIQCFEARRLISCLQCCVINTRQLRQNLPLHVKADSSSTSVLQTRSLLTALDFCHSPSVSVIIFIALCCYMERKWRDDINTIRGGRGRGGAHRKHTHSAFKIIEYYVQFAIRTRILTIWSLSEQYENILYICRVLFFRTISILHVY